MGKIENGNADIFILGDRGESVQNLNLHGATDKEINAVSIPVLREELRDKKCFTCNEAFTEKDIFTAIDVCNLTRPTSRDINHERCFNKVVEDHPEIKSVIGKPPKDWTKNDRQI